jgi:hypothetical protein
MVRFGEIRRGISRAGLIAACTLVLPAPVQAAAQDAKPEPVVAAASAPDAGNPKVSPYAIANRQHQAASEADPAHPLKRASGGSAAKPKTARADRH